MQVPPSLEEHVTPKSAARAGKRHKRRKYKNVVASKSSVGHKPNQLHVKLRGNVD
jgi:hypothetical protein